MEVQKIFKQKYADELRLEVKNGIGLDRYGMAEFPIDESRLIAANRVPKPEGLLEKLNPEDDCASAKALFEAYCMLTPLMAANYIFWESLSHIDLFSYVQNRWPKVKEERFEDKQYVLDHWFISSNPMEHPLADLWWSVNQTIDHSHTQDKYWLTDFLFKQREIRVYRFGQSTLFRYKPAVLGMLQYMAETPEMQHFFDARSKYIISYFNQLGAIKQLATLDRSFFYNELKRIEPDILAIHYREEVAGALQGEENI